jgi:hypothetical protein
MLLIAQKAQKQAISASVFGVL